MSAVCSPPSQVDELAARAGALYSLPAVAVEVLTLTNNPKVDVRALKECIERDPALTAKLLRVVNSSLFGLSRQVTNLNEALALLGVKPLKMLVLGFSLPETLVAGAGREQLDWYWRHTLARAVAARELCEQILKRPGDDVFVAALLQDVGVLVLLSELGTPYAQFLGEVIVQRANFHRVQVDELGIDHTELSARLLERWKMPRTIVDAIAEPRVVKRLAKLEGPHATTCRTLHLAEMTAQLVAERRLSILPDLLEAGEAYFDWTRESFDKLLESLEPKVAQLADVLNVPVEFGAPGHGESFVAIISAAHRQMAAIAEEAAFEMAAGEATTARDRESLAAILHVAAAPVREALDNYVSRPLESFVAPTPSTTAKPSTAVGPRATANGTAATADAASGGAATPESAEPSLQLDGMSERLALAIGACRAERQSLSVLAIAFEGEVPLDETQVAIAQEAIRSAWRQTHPPDGLIATDDPAVFIALLRNCDRQEGVAVGSQALRPLRRFVEQLVESEKLPPCRVAAGVATVNVPARNFPPHALLEASLRCLAASQRSQGAVKSIEIS